MFRGIVLADMILMHFSGSFPKSISFALQAVDFAIEGFIFLAGFMLGKHYFPRFQLEAREISKRLLFRAVKIGLVQYVLIISVSLPFFTYYHQWNPNEAGSFLIASLLFLNQVPILHILPTFIPFFLAGPLILWLMSKNKDILLVVMSVSLFAYGRWNTGAVGTGEKTIFPIALWQIYFVAGCLVGKWTLNTTEINRRTLLAAASLAFAASVVAKYGGYFDVIRDVKVQFDIYPKKFPLNSYGLAYGSSLLAFAFAWSVKLLGPTGPTSNLFSALSLLGRYSLFVFFLHVYAVYFVSLLSHIGASGGIIFAAIVGSMAMLYGVVRYVDRSDGTNGRSRAYRWLFA